MRLALIGAVRAESLGLFCLVGGMFLFLMGYVAGAQSRPPVFAAAPTPQAVAAAEPPQAAAANTPAECPAPEAASVSPRIAPTGEKSAELVAPHRVHATIIKDSPR